MLTFEHSENYLIPFNISEQWSNIRSDLIQMKKTQSAHHYREAGTWPSGED